jgi:hypothetical protein
MRDRAGLAAALRAREGHHPAISSRDLFVLPTAREDLDFGGIAKLTRAESGAQAERRRCSLRHRRGTPSWAPCSYMAPGGRQLRDRRWTGAGSLRSRRHLPRAPHGESSRFDARTAADRVTAILSPSPPPCRRSGARLVPGIGAVVARLLAKRPEEGRFGFRSDLGFTLDLLSRAVATSSRPSQRRRAHRASPSGRLTSDGEIAASRSLLDGPDRVVYQWRPCDGEPSDIYLSRVNLRRPAARILNGQSPSVSSTAEIASRLRARDIGGFVRLGTSPAFP